MAETLSLSLRAARHLHLAALGLLRKPRRRASPADITATVASISLLQIDTIHVVARSPYLVLFSRLGAFPQRWLDEALARGELIEYWAHEACFLPRTDFALVRHRMQAPEKMGWKYSAEWMDEHRQQIAELLNVIEYKGPVRAADLSTPRGVAGGWWQWKPHKRHLEGLFTAGKLMVTARHNFQRIYDLTERVMPEWCDTRDALPKEQAELAMLSNSARCLGIFRAEWLADYYRLRHVTIGPQLDAWQHEGVITPVEVERLGRMWLHHSLLPLLPAAQKNQLRATHTAVLSPFDPLVWDRRRVEAFFDFRYRLECYTPAAKRQFGYFALPLLHCGALIGRMDAKMHRKTGELEIIDLWLEEGVKPGLRMLNGLAQALNAFARWQGASRIRINRLPHQLAAKWGKGWEIPNSSVLC